MIDTTVMLGVGMFTATVLSLGVSDPICPFQASELWQCHHSDQ
ncbi:MAG: hypothetical protein CM15mP120_17760 [Pseudomonadota bacterium]|nr:MAG: hypothetical protein CM15mP120_17760 [Pseudomonadota bacterium]